MKVETKPENLSSRDPRISDVKVSVLAIAPGQFQYCGDSRSTRTRFELGVSFFNFFFAKITANLIRNGSTVAKLDSPASTILFSCVDQEFKHLVTISEDKKLKVWETDGLNVLSER